MALSMRCLSLACVFAVAASRFTSDDSSVLSASEDLRFAAVEPSAATGPAAAVAGATCGSHKLCAPCTHDSQCVWCADSGGSCVAADEKGKGPKDTASCKNFEVDYCINEPCSSYSNCHTCTTDPFCGFCHGGANGDQVCVEGEKKGPLTGYCPEAQWDHFGKGSNKCSQSEYFTDRVVEGATGIAGTDEGEAAKAIADMEKVAGQMSADGKNAMKTEDNLLGGQKKAYGLVGHLKKMIRLWRERKLKIKNAEHLDRGFFENKWKSLQEQRKERLASLQKIEMGMVGDIADDNKLLSRRGEQESKLEEAGSEDDKALIAGETSDVQEFAHHDWGGGLGSHMEATHDSFAALEKYLGGMSMKHKSLLGNLGRKARRALEKEMHASSVRKMAKQESSWYACAYLMQNPEAKCFEFHDKYAGVEKARELTAEEDTRVCNQVKAYIDAMKAKPEFKIPGTKTEFQKTAIEKDLYLGWCINNVHVDAKFAPESAL